jgi:hypothetical protein
MWTTQHTAETTAPPSAVWAALRDLHSGAQDPSGATADVFELHGPYAVGTTLSVTPQGQDTFTSTIVELVPNEVYADRTEFGGVTLLFRHTLTALGEGGTRITHTLEIDGEDADRVGPELGPQISEDFPSAMDALVESAHRLTEAGRSTR